LWAGIAGAPAWGREGDWPVSALLVKLCGGLEVYGEGERLTDDLVSRPAVWFMWVSLLLRWLLEPSRLPSRDGFAEEMAPGIDRESQLGRLRNLVADRKALRPSLAEAIRADRKTVTFDVEAAAAKGRFVTDIQLLHELADRGRRDTRYDVAEVAGVEKLVEACSSEVLPEFQSLDERITGEKGVGGELITALRSRHSDDLATVRVALAQTHLEAGSAAQAVELLRSALENKPDREDVARRLVAALIAAGRSSEAESVRAEYLS
jgi:hypothetical protein